MRGVNYSDFLNNLAENLNAVNGPTCPFLATVAY
jgi:hypothetical protein